MTGSSYRRIAIVGSGALGSYYGAWLARAGEDVRFLMRADLETAKTRGLSVKSPNGDFSIKINAYATPQEIGPCDLVIVALKTTSNAVLESLVRPLLHEGTTLLTLQNGLGSDELMAELFGPERIVGGLCFIGVNRVAPAEIVCFEPGSISFGEFSREGETERLRTVGAHFNRAELKNQLGPNLRTLRWRKLVWNVPFNGLSIVAGGVTTNQLLAEPLLEELVRALMREIIRAADVLGHVIPLTFIDEQIAATHKIGLYRPSSLVDFQAGREIEIEAIWGEPMRRAQRAGAAVPKLEMLYALLKNLTRSRGNESV